MMNEVEIIDDEKRNHDFNLSCCFENSDLNKPLKPIFKMIVGIGNSIKFFRFWLEAYLLEYKCNGVDGIVNNPKGCFHASGNNSRRARYICGGSPSCNWTCTITKNSKTNIWSITQINDSHINCTYIKNNLSAELININKYSKSIISKDLTANKMLENATELGFNKISSNKLYRARKKTFSKAEDFTLGFNNIESYLINLYESNPCSIIELQYYLDGDGKRRFGRLFISLRSMLEVLLKGCKPVISFDACFTKCAAWSKYQILVAELSEKGKYHCLPQQKANLYKVAKISRYGKSSDEIVDDHREVTLSVDLVDMKCSCGKPQGIPCRHLLCVADYLNLTSTILHENYIDHWFPRIFTNKCQLEAYDGILYSLDTSTHLQLTSYDLLPPLSNINADNRKSFKRIKSKQQRHTGDMTGSKVRKCSNCNSIYHLSNKCNIHIMSSDEKIQYIKDCEFIDAEVDKINFIKTNYKDSEVLSNIKNKENELIVDNFLSEINNWENDQLNSLNNDYLNVDYSKNFESIEEIDTFNHFANV